MVVRRGYRSLLQVHDVRRRLRVMWLHLLACVFSRTKRSVRRGGSILQGGLGGRQNGSGLVPSAAFLCKRGEVNLSKKHDRAKHISHKLMLATVTLYPSTYYFYAMTKGSPWFFRFFGRTDTITTHHKHRARSRTYAQRPMATAWCTYVLCIEERLSSKFIFVSLTWSPGLLR